MATEAKKSGVGSTVQERVQAELETAREKVLKLEAELLKEGKARVQTAQRVLLKEGRARVQTAQKALRRVKPPVAFRKIGKRAGAAAHELRAQIEHLPARVLDMAGVASAADVKKLSREVQRLSKRLNQVAPKAPQA